MKAELMGFAIYLCVSFAMLAFTVLRKKKSIALILMVLLEILIGSFALAVTIDEY